MAPYTSSTMAACPREQREDTLQVDSAKEVIDTFFHLLGEALESAPTYTLWLLNKQSAILETTINLFRQGIQVYFILS